MIIGIIVKCLNDSKVYAWYSRERTGYHLEDGRTGRLPLNGTSLFLRSRLIQEFYNGYQILIGRLDLLVLLVEIEETEEKANAG